MPVMRIRFPGSDQRQRGGIAVDAMQADPELLLNAGEVWVGGHGGEGAGGDGETDDADAVEGAPRS